MDNKGPFELSALGSKLGIIVEHAEVEDLRLFSSYQEFYDRESNRTADTPLTQGHRSAPADDVTGRVYLTI